MMAGIVIARGSPLFTIALLTAVLLADAAPSAAPVPPAAAPPSITSDKTAAKPDNDPLICRSEAIVGSRLPVRTCRHKSTWDFYTRRSRDAADDIKDRSRGPFYDRP